MRRLVLAAVLAAAAPALAQEAPPPPDDPAEVEVRPTAAQMTAVWPKTPQGRFVEGRVFLACKVSAAGVLSGCVTGRESPAGAGLAEAALKLVPHYKVTPAKRSGVAVDSEIVVPVFHFPFDKAPDWLRRPTSSDLLTVFPSAALSRGLNGRATMNCLVGTQGALSGCIPIYEDPPGLGFGAAAVALTPQFLMRPAQLRGEPVAAAVNIPIAFKTGGATGPDIGAKKVASPVSVWLEAPTVADVAAAYPARARAQKVGGRATIACDFAVSGRLVSCDTVTQEPKNLGFADAARDLAKKFLAKAPEGVRFSAMMVQIPVTFDPATLDAKEPVVGKPSWAVIPTADDMKAVMAALPKNRGAVRVMLDCVVEQQGALSGCRVESEQPAGEGFGQAALALSPKFRLATWTNDGLPVVGGHVRIPLRFDTGDPQPPPAAR